MQTLAEKILESEALVAEHIENEATEEEMRKDVERLACLIEIRDGDYESCDDLPNRKKK